LAAFGDPGNIRPYVAARFGVTVYPAVFSISLALSLGIEVPVTNTIKILPEISGTCRQISDENDGTAFGPCLIGGGVGIVF
jgi:hypothetical protein